jgi:SEC-C motif
MIPLFTSAPPNFKRLIHGCEFGPAWQAMCIESCKQAGFHPIKFKSDDRPLISDILTACRQQADAKIAGIINSDCMIIPHFSLADRLTQYLNDGVVVAERIDLNPDTLSPTGFTCYGFDAFFFCIDSLTDHRTEWRIGDTWWDYWFPLTFLASGSEIRTLPAPALVHVAHPERWDWDSWENNFRRFSNFVLAHPDLGIRLPSSSSEPAQHPGVGRQQIIAFLHDLYASLRSRRPLWTPELGSVDDVLVRMLISMSAQGPKQVSMPLPSGSSTKPALTPTKAGRNDPCPCGSGKKFKKCCGKAA